MRASCVRLIGPRIEPWILPAAPSDPKPSHAFAWGRCSLPPEGWFRCSVELETRLSARDGLIEDHAHVVGELLRLHLVLLGRLDLDLFLEEVAHRGLELLARDAKIGEDAANEFLGICLELLRALLDEEAVVRIAKRCLVVEHDVLLDAVLVRADDEDVLGLGTGRRLHRVRNLDGRHVRLERVVVQAALA